MPQRDPKGRFAPKSAEQAERPIDQMRSDEGAEASQLTTEQLYAELERRDREAGHTFGPTRDLPARPITGPEYDDDPRITPSGCLKVILVGLMLVVMAWLVWDKFAGGGHPQPAPPAPAPYGPVVPPAPGPVDLSAFTAPISAKLNYDPAKADRVAKIYEGLRAALVGPSGRRITDSRALEAVHASYLDDLKAMTGTPVGAEIDQAIGGYLGMVKSADKDGIGWEPKTFTDEDRAKLVQIVTAISQAGARAR